MALVNGVAITEAALQDEIENLYPTNSVHGGLRPAKLKEVRAQALEELTVQELVYEQAEKTKAVVPITEARAELDRLERRYGAQEFHRALRCSGLTRQQYLKNLQRRMTLERMNQQHVVLPSRVSVETLRDYYRRNPQKFVRPEMVHTCLITINVNAQAPAEEVTKAKEKIEMIYQQLKAGKDFGALAEQYSEDFYRVKGGDLGWVHRGRLEPDFEKVAFDLPAGQFSKPFRAAYGFSLMKVEGREPAQQMKFEEIQPVLRAELEQKKAAELRQAWISELKKDARVQILDAPPAPALQPAHASSR
jgi:peptidyl-prolyl cis-trans isomerase C